MNNVPTLDEHIAAAHTTSVKSWVASRGFEYMSAKDKEEFDEALPKLMDTSSEHPRLLEIFTDMEIDAECLNTILNPYKVEDITFRHQIGKIMPDGMKKTIKKIIK